MKKYYKKICNLIQLVALRCTFNQWKRTLFAFPAPNKKKIFVYAFRNTFWVEWAVYSCCYLIKLGYQPILIYSQKEISKLYKSGNNIYNYFFNFWYYSARLPHIQKINIDTYLEKSKKDRHKYMSFAKTKAEMVAVYNLRIEENSSYPKKYYQKALNLLTSYAAAMDLLIKDQKIKWIISPSGLIASSPAVLEAAKINKVTSVFVETLLPAGHMLWRKNFPALKYNIDGWLKVIGKWDRKKEKEMQLYFAFRQGEKVDNQWFRKFHQVQRSSVNAEYPETLNNFLKRSGKFYLMGTNVIGDSTTFEKMTIFKNQEEWISKTINFFKKNSQLNLIIRAHPDEIWHRSEIKLGELAEGISKGVKNIYIIKGEENINTVGLMDRCEIGLAWISNFGLEMALKKKPVILAAKAQYQNLKLCLTPKSQKEYFNMILRQNIKQFIPKEEKLWLGKAYFYIVFKKMTLLANSTRNSARDYRLIEKPLSNDLEKFYKILTGELDEYGQEVNK